jgi:ribosomal protein L4
MGRTKQTPKKNSSLASKIAAAKRKYSSSQVKLGHTRFHPKPRVPKGTTTVEQKLRALTVNTSKLHARLNPSYVKKGYFRSGRRIRDFRLQNAINPTFSDTDQPVIAVLGKARKGSKRNPITII